MDSFRYIATSIFIVTFASLVIFNKDIVKSIKSSLPDYEIESVNIIQKPKPTVVKTVNKKSLELDNRKIDALLSQQAPSLKRCHQNRIAEVGPIKGLALMGVTILPTGTVANVSLLKSNLNDPLLVQCLSRVLERVKFPKYNGGPKQRAFPIEFQ